MEIRTKAYYKLIARQYLIQEEWDKLQNIMKAKREIAKSLSKKSEERKQLMSEIEDIKNSEEYKLTKEKLELINYCVNIVFYN